MELCLIAVHVRTLAILQFSRELSLTALSRGRWREMRSEKEQMTAGKETNTVELQLRDIPGEQEHTPGSAKHKEEKKEVFSKVRGPGWATCRSSVYTPSERE